jgi:hypothetical protein
LHRLKLEKLQAEIQGENQRLADAKAGGAATQEILFRIQELRREEKVLKEVGKRPEKAK